MPAADEVSSPPARWGPVVAVVTGWIGLGAAVAATGLGLDLSPGVSAAAAAIGVGLPLWGFVLAVGDRALRRGAAEVGWSADPLSALTLGARSVGPACLAVGAAGVIEVSSDSGIDVPLQWALGGIAVYLLARPTSDLTDPPIFLPARTGHGLGPWAGSLLGLSLCFGALYVLVAARAEGNADNDAAYYFGVARHIVETGRYEEPILWHFLNPTAALVHPPFDYWQGATSLLLVPALCTFGATGKVALIAMGFVSAAALLAFWYLVCVAAPPRHAVTQLLALLLFATSASMATYRFDTETLTVVHLALLVGLAALARGHLVAVVLAGFAAFLTRADNVVVCGVLWCFALAGAVAGRRQPGRPVLRVALAAAGVVAAYVSYNLAIFGSPTPPGASRAPYVANGFDLFAYAGAVEVSWQTVLGRFSPASVIERGWVALETLATRDFVAGQAWWLALAVVPVFTPARNRHPLQLALWALLGAGSLVMSLANPAFFADWRTLHVMLPVFVLAGALGVDALADRGPHLAAAIGHPTGTLMVAALGVALIGPALSGVAFYPDRPRPNEAFEVELRRLDAALGGRPVATHHPHYVLANTHSPALMLPLDGANAIERALLDHRIDWIVLREPCQGWLGRHVCKRQRGRIGTVETRLVSSRAGVRLFELVRPGVVPEGP